MYSYNFAPLDQVAGGEGDEGERERGAAPV